MSELPPGLFTRYERTQVLIKHVATVTRENIGQIAELIKGSVDYRGQEPRLISERTGKKWHISIGDTIGFVGTERDPRFLRNENGFNRSGDWKEAP